MVRFLGRNTLVMVSLLLLGFCVKSFSAQPTRVLVIGTIHGNHETNRHYTYQDVVNILSTFAPDAICVEIRPADYRKNSYLKEMMLASIFGIERGLSVYPIDWWSTGDDRTRRSTYITTPEYKVKQKVEERLVSENKVMQEFEKKYGSLDKLWNSGTKGYDFFNGEEYNRYIEEMYGVSEAVYGDGPMNLSYKMRNDSMMVLIRNALQGHSGGRVVVLTGAEHKHYFDRMLAAMPNVELVKLSNILPLHSAPLSVTVIRFLEDNLAKGYFEESNMEGVDQLYYGALVPLIHGMGMDGAPETIPHENLPKAKRLLDEWRCHTHESALLQFECSWVDFLSSEYRQAIDHLEAIRGRLDQIPEGQLNFVKSVFDRNLGLCHDLLGEREKALECYTIGERICRSLGYSDRYIKYLFRDFTEHPYRRGM